MKKIPNFHLLAMLALAMVASMILSNGTEARAQRLERPPARDIEGTPVLPAGTQSIPAGTILILEMENKVDSGSAQVSDKFRSRIATPVVDAKGNTLIPADSIVEGHISSVRKAKWARRSGIIGVTFDNLRMPNGRSFPIRGYLTSADADDRKRIDDEGNLKGGALTKRDVVFVGGGAGAGAAIGAIAGGALAGAGIGAAAGLTATLLLKGKEAVIEESQRFGLELTQPLSLSGGAGPGGGGPGGGAKPRPVSPGSGNRPTLTPRPVSPPVNPINTGNMINTAAGPVDVYDVQATRGSDGLLKIMITAETPTNGWRIYENHELTPNSVEVRLRGVPTNRTGYPQLSYPRAPMIIIQDRNGRLRTVNVRGKNGSRSVIVNSGSGPSGPVFEPVKPNQPDFPPNNPPISRPTPTPVPINQGGNISTQASRVSNLIDQIRYDYGASIGVWINRDGTYDIIGQRRPTPDERQLMDSLGSLQNSVRALNLDAVNSNARRSNAMRVQEDARVVEQTYTRVSLSQNLNQRFKTLLQDTRSLVSSAER